MPSSRWRGSWPAAGLHAGVELRLYRDVLHRRRDFVISPALIAFALPSVARVEQTADKPLTRERLAGQNVRMLFIASTLMWTCNTMYIIDMPLWISSDLGLPDKLAGILMGTAAGLEIPAMILAGYYVKRFGKRRMMIVAVAAGVLFYAD